MSEAARNGTPRRPLWRSALKWVRRRTGPWLGVHDQYPPRPLRVPAAYHEAPALTTPPTISVVTPSYNQGRYLARTIESVLSQQYPALEYIVQDGGSTDDSVAVLERYRSRLHHAASGRDRGQSHALNLGFRHASGDILAYLNSDDLLLPGALHAVAHFFQDHPDVDVVYGHRVIIDAEGREVGRWVLPPHEDAAFAWNDYVPQETMFWRRGIWEKAGGRIAEEFHSAMDLELIGRFHAAGAKFHRLPRFLGAFRVHPQQKTETLLHDRGLPELRALRRRHHGRDITLWEARWRVVPYQAKHWVSTCLYRAGLVGY